MKDEDGVSLMSTSHPQAPWWRSLVLALRRPRLSPDSLETIYIAPALHAAAPKGLLCADCTMDKEACPTCYKVWWQRRHPNVQQMSGEKVGLRGTPMDYSDDKFFGKQLNVLNKAHNVDNKEIEQEIQDKRLTAPRVTLADIEACISYEYCATGERICKDYLANVSMPLRCLTICILVLKNGFTVTGESACVSPENFDAELGRKIARQKAVDKIWMLEGYLLKDRLSLYPINRLGGGGDFGDS